MAKTKAIRIQHEYRVPNGRSERITIAVADSGREFELRKSRGKWDEMANQWKAGNKSKSA